MAVKKIQILLRDQAAKWYDGAMREPRNPLFPLVWQRLNDIRIGAYPFETSPGETGMDTIPVGDGSHIHLAWVCPKWDDPDRDDRTSSEPITVDLQANRR